MNDEVEETVKESEAKSPKRKIGKRGKIAIIATVIVIGIIISSYVAIITAPQEKYCKAEKEFKMPAVDWSNIKSSYVVERKHYNDINGTVINQTIGSKKSDGNFEVVIVVDIISYNYDPSAYDLVKTHFYIFFTKLSGDYTVKDLMLKYEPSDNDVCTPSFDDYYFAAKNLYFTADVGNYPTPYGSVSDRMDYELWTVHQIRGVNKDARDIKDGGFSNSFEIELFDSTTSGKSHNITFHAILHYGKYVHGLFGEHWEDMHTLDTYVKIYIVPEGGE